MRFAPEYVSLVLNENFEDAKALFLEPLMAIHYAHLVMLADRGIVSARDAGAIRRALDGVDLAFVRKVCYDGTCEDLFFYVEDRLVDALGRDVAGRLHTARSRNDIDMTLYRMRQREYILGILQASLGLRETLLTLAEAHRETVLALHTHTQPAQPSTVAHYLLAVVEQLERDATRLQAAFASTNRNPLGACAITGTGFPIDRHLTSRLLGFSGPTGNTYGSIATVDYLLENVSAAAVLLTGLGRFVQDMLLWSTMEFSYLRLGDGFVQGSSIMPQKRNPDVLELVRSRAARVMGCAGVVQEILRATPSGYNRDLQDTKEPYLEGVAATRAALRVLDPLIRATKADAPRLAAGFTPDVFATDRALELVVGGMPFRDAYHHVKANLGAVGAGDPVRAARAKKHLGAPGGLDFALLHNRAAGADGLAAAERDEFNGAVSRLLHMRYPPAAGR